MSERSPAAVPLDAALGAVGPILRRVGLWTARWPYWWLFLAASVVVVLKTGFRWAGTTGQGWFLEFRPAIDAWPLKEPLGSAGGAVWQEDWSSIVVFKAATRIGLPYDSATWNFVHVAASVGAVAFLGAWIRRTYGDDLGRMVALLFLFGAVPMVLLQEIGRYDSFFFLGAVFLAVGRRWWTIVGGAVLLGASSWTMGLGLAGSLVLVGLVLRSRVLIVRGCLALAGCGVGALTLMGLRVLQGGDPWLVRLGTVGTDADGRNVPRLVYKAWNNLVLPFPNWVYAVFGITWILVALVLLQAPRRRVLLGLAIVVLPLVAAAINSDDGTREVAFVYSATLFAIAAVLQARATTGLRDARTIGVSPAVLGFVLIVAVLAPVIDIYPTAPLNTYRWLSDYGLSFVYSILGPG